MTATLAKERPILFSGEMVRAILDGRKTQARRIVKPQPQLSTDGYRWQWKGKEIGTDNPIRWIMLDRCPYGCVGDRLWVRESFDYVAGKILTLQDGETTSRRIEHIRYRANGGNPASCNWTPSIHMPRWASRITLELVDVRIHRLQDITEDDAIAEGAQCAGFPPSLTNRGAFAKLWDKINGAGAWERNQWVWVIEFKVVTV